MLAGLRNAAKSKWAAPIIIFLALSFAVWGVNDMFRGGPKDAVAVVGPEKISASEYREEFDRRVQTISRQNDGGFTAEDAKNAGLDRQILGQMITMATLDAQTGEFDLGASDQALLKEIHGIEAFRDPVIGDFSRDQYRASLAGLRMTERQFEQQIRGDIVRQQLIGAIRAGESAPQSFSDRRQAFAGETRRADVLALAPSLAGDIGEPTDSGLQDIIDSNEAAFTVPERRAITVAWLDPASFEQTVDVSEEDLNDLYEYRKDSLSEPASRSYVQIQYGGEEQASAAAARLNQGETAQAVADDTGAELIEDADAAKIDVVDGTIADALFAMSPDDSAKVVEGRFGWSVIDVIAATDANTPSLDDVRGELRSELAKDRATENMYDAIGVLEDSRGAGAPLESAAAEAGIPAMSYLPLSQRGRGPHAENYARIAAAPQILQLAFQMQEGETSALEDIDNQGFALIRVDRVEPSEVLPLEDAREPAEQVWRATKLQEKLKEIADSAVERVKGGEKLSAIAADIGAGASVESVSVKRSETAGNAGPRLIGALFEAAPGDVVTESAAQGGEAVAVLREISVDQTAPAPAAEEMASEVSDDLLIQYQAALQRMYDVKTYPDQIAFALGDDVPR